MPRIKMNKLCVRYRMTRPSDTLRARQRIDAASVAFGERIFRSEERRVGKEC